MFGFFKLRFPITAEQRTWIDTRWSWLEKQFGTKSYTAPIILPLREFFPDPYDRDLEGAEAIFKRTCQYMGVRRSQVSLSFFEQQGHENAAGFREGAAGLYAKADPNQKFDGKDDEPNDEAAVPAYSDDNDANDNKPGSTDTSSDEPPSTNAHQRIAVHRSKLRDPMSAVAVMTHELGHARLLGENRISHDEPDHEPLTDLLTVFLGMGIFNANARIRDKLERLSTLGSQWTVGTLGYLTQEEFGYALARFALARGENKPKWMKYLRPDLRLYTRVSLKCLRKGVELYRVMPPAPKPRFDEKTDEPTSLI